MSIFERLKVLTWLWRTLGKMNKLKELLGKLDGYKSLFGLLGVVGYYGAQAAGVNPPSVVLETSVGLLGVGLVHKLDKATGIIKKVLPFLGAVLEIMDKKKEEEKK